jgi:hypothetical protein
MKLNCKNFLKKRIYIKPSHPIIKFLEEGMLPSLFRITIWEPLSQYVYERTVCGGGEYSDGREAALPG